MRICVIGAGASGLTSIKACKEENVDVVCYERSRHLGGLWNYNEDDLTVATVARSTIINSSKELSAFSDFVPPEEFPNYMHNSLMLKYFELYADKFDLRKHIVFKTEVVKVNQADDYDTTGKWNVQTKNLETNEVKNEIFDSVMVCVGHHGKPQWPKFKNQDKFKGEILHTHSYKRPDGFEDKRIVVVGIGNSGGDAAAELSIVARKVYLSTRRGSWIISRMSTGGLPVDGYLIRRLNSMLLEYIPSLANSIIENIVDSRFDHGLYGLKPKHRIFGQHPTVNDSLPNRILSGTVEVKGDIQEFTENGVIFKGDHNATSCDVVVFATGYEISFPFLEQRIIDNKDNKAELYKYQYLPKIRHPHTLAIIGLIQPFGPLVPISESQARWHLQLMKKKCKPLPSIDLMLSDIHQKKEKIRRRYYESKRHTIQVDVISFMDEIAEQYGAKPSYLELFFTDPVLWAYCTFKQSLPYQYRLTGPHSNYDAARDAILKCEDRVKAALKTNDQQVTSIGLMNEISKVIFSFFAFIIMLFVR